MAPTRGLRAKPTSKSTKKGSTGTSKAALKVVKDPKHRISKNRGRDTVPKQPSKKTGDRTTKKKKKIYTDRELGLPKLNMVTPIGVQKPRGKKKGKVFIDDPESMMTILAIVNAEKEGQIESKMIKARHMEEIREARKAEADRKEQLRRAKLDETKDSLRKRRRRSLPQEKDGSVDLISSKPEASRKPRKKVSFG